jgi:hypothetical protein
MSPTFSLEFEVFCGKCGAGLCNQSSTSNSNRRQMNAVNVDPCKKCITEACEEAADAAHARGFDAGYAAGQMNG